MSAFYFALLVVLLCGYGARDQVLLARRAAHSAGSAPLIIAIATGIATTALAAWLATLLVDLRHPDARTWLATFALILAASELLLARVPKKMREPTRSFGAYALVMATIQAFDGARFMVFALAVSLAAPIPAALGGALATAAYLWLGWAHPDLPTHPRARSVRRIAGGVLLALAVILAMRLSRIL